jgi:hypothetical protein
MGAYDFTDYSFGRDVDDAFSRAVQEAQWQHGHGGYTGTIAEKYEWVEYVLPGRVRTAAEKLIGAAMNPPSTMKPVLPRRADYPKNRQGRWAYDSAVRTYRNDRRALVRMNKTIPPRLRPLVMKMAEVAAGSKWGPAACFRLPPVQEKEYRERHDHVGKTGGVWAFFGYASS